MKYYCHCGCNKFDKGRGVDGRRAYRCKQCGHVHTAGLQGRNKKFSSQRQQIQFFDTGASRLDFFNLKDLLNELNLKKNKK
ncbi:MAG: hypothetical protein ABFD07_19460 [Methanobacterium sp.]